MAKKLINGRKVSIFDNVRDAYGRCYPKDNMTESLYKGVSFVQLLARMESGEDFYNIIFHEGSDSIVRERIFTMMSTLFGEDYDTFYNMWINRCELRRQRAENNYPCVEVEMPQRYAH